jgi:hypothetical protein
MWDALAGLSRRRVVAATRARWADGADRDVRRLTAVHPDVVAQLDRPITIEPKYGFVIADHAYLVEASVANGDFGRHAETRHLFGSPSPLRYLIARCRPVRLRRFADVVSCMTAWPENYFHFFSDFLPRLALLDASRDDLADVPILVHDRLAAQPFFEDARQHGRLAELNFTAPDQSYVRADRVSFAATPYGTRKDVTHFLRGVELLDLPTSREEPSRRVFLNRPSSSGRALTNFDEVRPLLEDRGFEIVDTSALDLASQAALFRSARFVAGIHGAAFANILWCSGQSLDLLELRPPGARGRTDYVSLCEILGFGHREIFGVETDDRVYWHESFAVDADGLAEALDELLGEPLHRVG